MATSDERDLGRLEGIVSKGFEDLGRRMDELKDAHNDTQTLLRNLRRDVDQNSGAIAILQRGHSSDQANRRDFWGRTLEIIVAIGGYALAFWHPWTRHG